jgi:hypothetical protein
VQFIAETLHKNVTPRMPVASAVSSLEKGKIKGKGKVIPVLSTEHHAMKACWGSGRITSLIL